MSLIYLASPYSSRSPEVQVMRYLKARTVNARMMREGRLVYSPIAHCHAMHEYDNLPGDWQFWAKFDRAMITACDELVVLMLDGWRESIGVTAEIAIAVELGKPVSYMNEEGDK